jgi:hypothetical protein
LFADFADQGSLLAAWHFAQRIQGSLSLFCGYHREELPFVSDVKWIQT